MNRQYWPEGWKKKVSLTKSITMACSEKNLGKGTFLHSYGCTLSVDEEHNGDQDAVLKWGIINDRDSAKKISKLMRGLEKIPKNDNVLEMIHGEVNLSCPSTVFYVMPRMQCNLQEFILQNHKRTYRDILTVFEQICSGLKHLHAQRSFFHSLKPTNVMISVDENHNIVAKISRFSLSMVGGLRLSKITAAKHLVENTSPPEVAAQVAFNTPKRTCGADIFSFGVLMWIVLNRKIDHEEDSCEKEVGRSIKWPLISKREYAKWCHAPPELCDLVESCLSYKCPKRSSDEQGRPCLEDIYNVITKNLKEKWIDNIADAYRQVQSVEENAVAVPLQMQNESENPQYNTSGQSGFSDDLHIALCPCIPQWLKWRRRRVHRPE